MMMKVFPHGMGEGDKPTRYLVRPDYPGREENPPEVLRGDVGMTRALIDSIDRRWKFTSGVLAWHPDDKVSPEKEEGVMDAFERVAFAGLEPDQRNILWVRHIHAGHHELHFVIPRLELSSGKAFNACPPGWQKDFDVFRDLFNHQEQWARPDDPARERENPPKKADLFKARLGRWGKEVKESGYDKAREAIHAYLKARIVQGLVSDRAGILAALKEAGLSINRAGRDYISVKDPESGKKLRFKGGIYYEGWTPRTVEPEENEEEQPEKTRAIIARLEQDLVRVLEKRGNYNRKRYPPKWPDIEQQSRLVPPEKQETLNHDGIGKDAQSVFDPVGAELPRPAGDPRPEAENPGGQPNASPDGIADLETLVQRCQRSVR
ncbi:MAG: relaxase/mobilization nuclease domain-containing protein, partial [Desulfovibrio sp.]|nr:relaxase/mobilization nuclease domain-containing protein [Desulfovibrio sp.]